MSLADPAQDQVPASGAAARAHAAQVVDRVAHRGTLLDEALRIALHPADGPAPQDTALIQEMSYGTLRWFERLEAIAARARAKRIRDSDLRALLLVGLYQLLYMRVPAHAAVCATVDAASLIGKPHGKGLVNACLRRFQRERTQWLADLRADITATWSHPPWLIAELQRAWPQRWQSIAAANNSRPPLALRVNLLRTTRSAYLARLQATGIAAQSIEHTDCGIVLQQPLAVTALPGFNEGELSVQDAGAQLAAPALDLQPGQRVLDACAAPGGKLCHMLEHCPELGQVIALDREPARAALIEQNLARLGLHAATCVGDASEPVDWWDGVPFDRVLLDLPCSATGVIRRHPDVKRHRNPHELGALAQTQRLLLTRLWPLLRHGGKLLYVTCSVLPKENEEVLQDFLVTHGSEAAVLPLALPFSVACNPGVQILPGEGGMDGFFYACLQRR